MKISLHKLILTSILSLLTISGFAQFNSLYFNNKTHRPKEKLKLFQRVDIGFHTMFNRAFYDYYSVLEIANPGSENTISITDDTYKMKNMGIGGNIGAFLPIGHLGYRTKLGLNLEAYYTSHTYETTNFQINGNPADAQVEFKSTFISVPVGLDVRWGGQSSLSKDDWASASIGGGIAPTYFSTKPESNVPDFVNLLVRPYIRAEFGFHTGIFWKIKGMVQFRQLDIVNINESEGFEQGQTNTSLVGTRDQTLYTRGLTYSLGLSINLGSIAWTRAW